MNDSRVRSKVIEVRSNGQEAFVHEVRSEGMEGRVLLWASKVLVLQTKFYNPDNLYHYSVKL